MTLSLFKKKCGTSFLPLFFKIRTHQRLWYFDELFDHQDLTPWCNIQYCIIYIYTYIYTVYILYSITKLDNSGLRKVSKRMGQWRHIFFFFLKSCHLSFSIHRWAHPKKDTSWSLSYWRTGDLYCFSVLQSRSRWSRNYLIFGARVKIIL